MIAIGDYLYHKTITPLLGASLVYFFDDPMFSKTEYDQKTIVYLNKHISESFSKCVIEALNLIESTKPLLSRVVSRNIKYIFGQRPTSKTWLGLYHSTRNICSINWTGVEKRSYPERIQILAGVIVHEAYHGECYKIFGCKAYELEPIERICRNRETRLLAHFISLNPDRDNSELQDRISYLKEQNQGMDLTR